MQHQRGQVLLIIVLLSTVLLTIGLSISQITTQETQIAKLEEESKKAFAAAEAGLDAVLKTPGGSVVIGEWGGELNLGAGISGQATVDTTPKPTFLTPLLKKDEQYTIYLADYVSNNFSNYFSGDLTFYLGSGSSCPTLELTIISNTNGISRRLINPSCSSMTASDIPTAQQIPPVNFQGTSFNYKTTSPLSINNTKLIIVRVLFAETKIGIERISGASTVLPFQGKTISSSASTSTGVSKKIQLFQSYPQIPSDFFVTSF